MKLIAMEFSGNFIPEYFPNQTNYRPTYNFTLILKYNSQEVSTQASNRSYSNGDEH